MSAIYPAYSRDSSSGARFKISGLEANENFKLASFFTNLKSSHVYLTIEESEAT